VYIHVNILIAVTTAEVSALQQCVLLQRSHPIFWMDLAGGYRSLQQLWRSGVQSSSAHSTCTREGAESADSQASAGGDHCQMPSSAFTDTNLQTTCSVVNILSRTIQLFRPYLSWKRSSEPSDQSGVSSGDKLSVPMSTLHCSDEDNCPFSGCCISSDCTTSREPELCPEAPSMCSQHSILHEVPLPTDRTTRASEDYALAVLSAAEHTATMPPLGVSSSAQSSPSPCLCLDHSLFVVLVRGLLLPAHAGRLGEEAVSGQNPILNHLACQFAVMAECSCLLWARSGTFETFEGEKVGAKSYWTAAVFILF